MFNVVVVDVYGLYAYVARSNPCASWGVAIASGREYMRCRRWGWLHSGWWKMMEHVYSAKGDALLMIFEGWLHGKLITNGMNEVVVSTEHGGCFFWVFLAILVSRSKTPDDRTWNSKSVSHEILASQKRQVQFYPPERLTAKAPFRKKGRKTILPWESYHIHWTNEKTDGWNVGRWFKPDIEMLPFQRGPPSFIFLDFNNLSVAQNVKTASEVPEEGTVSAYAFDAPWQLVLGKDDGNDLSKGWEKFSWNLGGTCISKAKNSWQYLMFFVMLPIVQDVVHWYLGGVVCWVSP